MIFYLGYLVPMIITIVLLILFEENVRTVKDLLEHWWCFIIPALNLFVPFIFLLNGVTYCFKKWVNTLILDRNWNKFLNFKFKKYEI